MTPAYCSTCDTTYDNMTELAHHECEPTRPTPEEAHRVRAVCRRRTAAEQEANLAKAELEFEWR